MIVPLTVGKVFGIGEHHFEIAGGFIFARRANEIYDNPEPTERIVFLTGFVGYRYQVMNKRFFFRTGFNPFWRLYYSFDYEGPGPFYPWVAISGGFRF